jgi:hypothetical protein
MASKTGDEWAADLKKLIARAQAAIASGNQDEKDQVSGLLSQFIDDSPMSVGGELDDLAEAAIAALVTSEVADATAQISKVATALSKHVKRINEITAGNKKTAAVLRLESVTAVVDSASGFVAEIKKLEGVLKEDGESQSTIDQLQAVVKTVQEFRSKVEKL